MKINKIHNFKFHFLKRKKKERKKERKKQIPVDRKMTHLVVLCVFTVSSPLEAIGTSFIEFYNM